MLELELVQFRQPLRAGGIGGLSAQHFAQTFGPKFPVDIKLYV